MNEVKRIVDLLQRSFDGPAWHGPSVIQALKGVNAAVAARKSPGQTHSIWELVLHISAWERIVMLRLQGKPPVVSDEDNFPQVKNTSLVSWKKCLYELRTLHESFVMEVSRIKEKKLDAVLDSHGSVYLQVHGALQHNIYHAGQISLLKKNAKRGK